MWSAFFVVMSWFEDPTELQELYDFDEQRFKVGELKEKVR